MAGSEASTFNLKHRLVGALVLVLCAVVLLPKLLTGDGQRGETAPNWATEMQIEPQFDQDFVSRIVAAPSAPEPSTASETSTKDVTPPPGHGESDWFSRRNRTVRRARRNASGW